MAVFCLYNLYKKNSQNQLSNVSGGMVVWKPNEWCHSFASWRFCIMTGSWGGVTCLGHDGFASWRVSIAPPLGMTSSGSLIGWESDFRFHFRNPRWRPGGCLGLGSIGSSIDWLCWKLDFLSVNGGERFTRDGGAEAQLPGASGSGRKLRHNNRKLRLCASITGKVLTILLTTLVYSVYLE